MPRSKVRTVNTPIQGDKAWVVFRVPSVGEVETMSRLEDTEAFTAGKNLIVEHVIKWNWADENNVPLPLPGEMVPVLDEKGEPVLDEDGNPVEQRVVDDCTLDEFAELSEILLSRSKAERKN